MAENVTVARPYADAAFELARAGGSLDAWADVLARLAVIVSDERVVSGIHDPALARERLARFVIEVAGQGVTEAQANFVHLLAENDRLPLLPEIRDLFVALKDKEEG
ncbi:MAG: ATP synthase F1 subunit delta, partial [Rhodocyclaceae bacterium]|nr:ATP synthase F1 subunit delta [Rhodocyclaceae bacterium]